MSRFALAGLLALAGLTVAQEPKTDEPKLSAEEKDVLDLTNAERRAAGLPPLAVNAKLLDAARAHAANMAKQAKLEHVLDGKTHADRTKAAGYESGFVGENIAWNAKSPKDTLAVWMTSQGHKENILSKDYTEVGVAVAKSEKGEPYWVQVFGKR